MKGVNFADLRDAGDPVEMAQVYDAEGADELTFLDITASSGSRETTYDVVGRTAEQVFIPLTVGGGVREVGDVDRLLRAGADKVGINTGAIARPDVIREIAHRFGNQVLVLSLDVRRSADQPSGFEVTTHGGRKSAGLDAIEWAKRGCELGAGEILLNSMDADGTKQGFDLELIKAVRAVVDVPLIASGERGHRALPARGRGRSGRSTRGQRVPLRRLPDRRREEGPPRRGDRGPMSTPAHVERSEEMVAAIEQELSALFRRSRSASLRLARRVHPEMDAAGYALISQIEMSTGNGAGVRASDIAEVLGLDKSTVSRGITQLETLGLIERVGDPDDGRARLLRLTTTGAERYEAMRTQRQTEFRAILDRWNPTDLSDLGRLLARLNTDLG